MIVMTQQQYEAIRQLKDFAQWYISEHEGSSGAQEMIDQWEEDRQVVQAGVDALKVVDATIRGN